MTSKVQICNQALSKLGKGTITSLTEGTEAANLCNLFIDSVIDQVCVEGHWPSTIVRRELAKDTVSPSYGFDSQFSLPNSPYCLKVLEVNSDNMGYTRFKVEGRKLLSDSSTVKIKYIARPEAVTQMDPLLIECIVYKLALELAYPITGSTSGTQLMEQMYRQALQRGQTSMNQQGSDDIMSTDDLIDVRY